MKPIFVLLALLFVAGACTEARAQSPSGTQEAESDTDTDTAPVNVPSMVVRENPAQEKLAQDKPAQDKLGHSKQAQAKGAQGKSKPAQGAADVAVPTAAAGIAAGQYITKPIVFTPGESIALTDETTGNPDYDKLVMESAARNGIDPKLIMAVMRQESRFNPHSRSYKGACGLMQLMPDTARRFGVANIFDPAQNIEGGAKYLRFLLDKFDGDVKLTLAGYNAGEMAVVGAGYKVPRYKETQNYVRTISARYGAGGQTEGPKAATGSAKPNAVVMSSSVLSNNY